MFKKKFKVSSHSLLSGKDKKKLKLDLEKQFDQASIDHFFQNNSEIFCDKINASGSKMLLIGVGETPFFIDSTTKGDLFPSCQCLTQYPDMIKTLILHPKVEDYLKNGANLMWPGVQNFQTIGDFQQDSVWQVRDHQGNIVAVGAMAISSEEKKKNKSNEGIALFILSLKDDVLSSIGPQKLEIKFQNKKPEPIVEPIIEPVVDQKIEQTTQKEEEKEEEEEEEEDEDEDEDDLSMLLAGKQQNKPNRIQYQQKVNIAQKNVFQEDKKIKQKKKSEDFSDDIQKINKKEDKKDDKKDKKKDNKKDKKKDNKKDNKKDKKKRKESNNNDSDSDNASENSENSQNDQSDENSDNNDQTNTQIPIRVMDEYIMEAFLNSLYLTLNQKDLPIEGSQFYQNHILLCKNQNIHLDVKNSTYKKIGKFFQNISKLGLIEYKEIKKGGNSCIIKINMNHAKIKNWTPTINKPGSNTKNESKEKETTEDEHFPKVEIIEVYKIQKKFKKVFGLDDDDNPSFTSDQIKSNINKYINENCKIEKKIIHFDELMTSLFSKPSDEIQSQFSKEEFYKTRLEIAILPFHQITVIETKKQSVKSGKCSGIQIIAEKSHNKNITKIQGLEIFMINLDNLAEKFQKKFACSAGTQDIPGHQNIKELVVQGNFITEIVEILQNDFKIEQKYINQLNKLDKKKKK